MLVRRGKAKQFTHVRRVPKRYQKIDERRHVFTALHTGDLVEAKAKQAEIERLQVAIWEARLAGVDDRAVEMFDRLREIAERRGFVYIEARDLAQGPMSDILARGAAINDVSGAERPEIAKALLGCAPAPSLRLSGLLERFADLTADRWTGKSEDQKRRWNNERNRAIANLIDQVGDKEIEDLTRSDILRFRTWWWSRVEAGSASASSANKDFSILGAMIGAVIKLEARSFENPLAGVRFQEVKGQRLAFSRDWVRDRIMADGVLAGLNLEARTALLIMINTGARPSEILGLTADRIRLDQNIPYIAIRAGERALKTEKSARDIPLTGVSLEAARACPSGFPRYADKATSWSNLVMKYLRNNGLLETENHSTYSLRHMFSDSLQNIDCPDRTRKELMGHAVGGVVYGQGASLETKLSWLGRIAL